jgi:hypothetical protein
MILLGSMSGTFIHSFAPSNMQSFHIVHPTSAHGSIEQEIASATSFNRRGSTVFYSSTSTRPLYDGTNYTFPDTRTPAGVAELLEVSFVHACMQLASGYVDVLKMFIAASISAYEAGFSIDSILEELENNKEMPNTANRPLMEEEIMLRRDWLGVIYLTLASMEYTSPVASALAMNAAKQSVPEDVQQRYGEIATRVGESYRSSSPSKMLSVEDLDVGNNEDLSPIENAVLLQSLKVATLTPVVVEEAKEALGSTDKKRKNDTKPPTPPIEGAF